MTDAYDASDPVVENNAHRDEVRRQRDDAETVKRLLSQKTGRAWFYRRLTSCHIYGTPFMPGQAETTFFQMGQENIGKQMMMEAIESCPDLYLKMIAEARDEQERIASNYADTERKREKEENAGRAMQGFDLPPPQGWPGHTPPIKPEGRS